jgi:hypothetical protein
LQYNNNQLLVDDFARNGFAWVIYVSSTDPWGVLTILPFRTYLPDYLNGDPITEDMFKTPGFSSDDWFKTHGAEHTRPPLDAVMKALKDRGIKEFGVVGYCKCSLVFSFTASFAYHPKVLAVTCSPRKSTTAVKLILASVARYGFDLAFDHLIKVCATAHPSRIKVPEDLEVCHF